jgi:NAD(P)-dependent dehydrogenase (short-subunit alcohol dehydrogenase family)
MTNKFQLTDRVALVTGAAGLLGVEHVKALLECQALVVLTDINEDSLKEVYQSLFSEKTKHLLVYKVMDVTCKESIQKVADELSKDDLFVEILINNAAIDPKVKENSALEMSRFENFLVDDWNFQLKVGLTGAMLCSQVFGSLMASHERGVILNIASDLSVIAPDQRLYMKDGVAPGEQPVKPVSYSVIKHALIGLTKYLSTYWADKGVRCNALSPGGILAGQDTDFVKKIENLIPMQRMASKDEYRGAIQFLCSDASSYLNGQNIVMDGGRSAL